EPLRGGPRNNLADRIYVLVARISRGYWLSTDGRVLAFSIDRACLRRGSRILDAGLAPHPSLSRKRRSPHEGHLERTHHVRPDLDSGRALLGRRSVGTRLVPSPPSEGPGAHQVQKVLQRGRHRSSQQGNRQGVRSLQREVHRGRKGGARKGSRE